MLDAVVAFGFEAVEGLPGVSDLLDEDGSPERTVLGSVGCIVVDDLVVSRPKMPFGTAMALKERLLAQAGVAGLAIGSSGLGCRDSY